MHIKALSARLTLVLLLVTSMLAAGAATSHSKTKTVPASAVLSATACEQGRLAAALDRFSGEQATTLDGVVWFSGGQTDDGKAASAANPLLPAHCIVTGVIGAHSGPPGATRYGNHFRLRIPSYWNGRLFFQGGGGNNGSVGNAIGPLKDGQNALAQGYAVVAQDSGHVGRTPEFALDRKAYTDFAYQGVHDVSLVAKAIIKAYAGRGPARSYFVGCSNGGREAMVTAQRYTDFDGVVAGNPGFATYDQWLQNMDVLRIVARVAGVAAGTVAVDTSSAYRDDQLAFVADYFMEKCDKLDGVADGLVSNYLACKAGPNDYQKLLCKQDGGDSDDPRCLNGIQSEGLQGIHAGVHDRNHKLIFPGFLPGSVERVMRDPYLGKPGGPALGSFYSSIMPNLYFMGYGFRGYPHLTGSADELASYPASSLAYVADFDIDSEPAKLAQGRLDFNGGNVDPRRPGPNFEAFRRRGGKMLIYTGTADPAVQATGVMAFMDRLNAQYQPKEAGAMARLFMVPGMNHCRGGATADQFDQLAPLVEWVERGIAPEEIVARAAPGSELDRQRLGFSRPLCVYPRYAKYKGSGDPAAANSFVCSSD